MAISNLTVTGAGGNPPSQILVEGEVTGCEIVQVVSSCTANPVQINIPTGGTHNWSAILSNDKGCECGEIIKVVAWCGLGQPGSSAVTLDMQLTCGNCPSVNVTADPPGPCVNGKRSVTFHATAGNVPSAGVAMQWKFPNSNMPFGPAFTVTNNGALADQTVEYPVGASGPVTYTATLDVILPSGCMPVDVPVTIDPCKGEPPLCCPDVTLLQPAISGCAPGSAKADFTATLTWPEDDCTKTVPSSYLWTLNGSNNKKYRRSTSQPNTDTSTPWTDVSTGNPSAVQFVAGGSYSIAVVAIIPGIDLLSCMPTDTRSFIIPACCPQLTGPLNASQKPDDPCTWIFSAQVSNPNNAAVSFEWSFHDGTSATTSLPQVLHTYAPGSAPGGVTALTLKSPGCPDQSLNVTITHSCIQCPPGQHRDASGKCVPDTPPDCPPGQHRDANGNCVPDRPSDGGSFNFCAGLLVAAVSLFSIGALGIISGLCLSIPWLWIAGTVLGGIGIALFVLWVIFCSRFTP
ncbi:MAG TPA: hypothetical protein PLO24_05445, partial [Bacteroidales bacterium]|nr:hypothetical protein [Bacteroidales bacterium]